jgi:uncharacterized protein YeaO (DUF488 family)
MIKTKRAHDRPARNDGTRILVDRSWPQGVRREEARIDLKMNDIAPSDGLRKWFRHDPRKWGEFKERYYEELGRDENKDELVEDIMNMAERGTVTLVYGARDRKRNNAVALREYMKRRGGN